MSNLFGWLFIGGFGLADSIYASALFVSISVCYLLFYTVIQWDSPTLSLTYFILEAGPAGRSYEEMEAFVRARGLVHSRYAQLKNDRIIVQNGDHVELAQRGSVAIRIGEAYRRAMGRETQGL